MPLRAWHSYLSIFVAPSVLFFAFTGALQLFNLHEAHEGYQPLAVIEKLGRLHKDQIFALDERHDAAPPTPSAPSKEPPGSPVHNDDDKIPLKTFLLKWLFLIVALALLSSTCIGVWIGLTHAKRRRLSWLLLSLGAVLPVVLIVI